MKKVPPSPKIDKHDNDPFDGVKAIGCLFAGVVILGIIFFFLEKFINHLRP